VDRKAFVSFGEGTNEPHQAALIISVQRLVGADLVYLDREQVLVMILDRTCVESLSWPDLREISDIARDFRVPRLRA
jgi:hypothetical protein